jgi:hypothetical protein
MPSAPALALTRPLLDWLRASPQWNELGLGVRARLRWHAALGEFNSNISARLNSQAQSEPLADPVFIIGPWRSGTTVMHELLVAATGLPTPRTWHCMNAPAFLLSSAPRKSVQAARPMDGLLVGSQSPQEDEFALLSLGIDSAYRGFLMPSRLPELAYTLDPTYWLNSASWLPSFEAFLRGVLLREGNAHETLLLKSPNHTFRAPALLRRFPRARFIWMARDASDVLQSNRKMWRQMMERYGLQPMETGVLDAFLHLALDRSAEVLEKLLTQCMPQQLFVCAHTQLQAQPIETLRQAATALELPLAETALAEAESRTRQGRVERYSARIQHPSLKALDLIQRQALQR